MCRFNHLIVSLWLHINNMIQILLLIIKEHVSRPYFLTVIITTQIITIIPVPMSNAKAPTSADWKRIDLVYFQDFPWHPNQSGLEIPGCFVALNTLSTSGFGHMPVLRCKEQIHLLRPDSTVQNWKKNQAKNGFIKMSLPEFELHYVKAKITAIASIPANKMQLHGMQNKNTDQITGMFIRHATNVKKYRFKEESTGHIITVNATDNHLFYVKNKHAFIPAEDISPIDQLITQTGGQIRLLCSDNKWHNCGHKTAQFVQPTPVHNLEIRLQHTYFISNISILVHNDCTRTYKEIRDDNGRLTYAGFINDETGNRDGMGTSYHSNGKVAYLGLWENNQPNGFGHYFNEQAYLWQGGIFKDGELNGNGFINHENSYQIDLEGIFEMGFLNDSGVKYFPSGNKQYEGTFRYNLPHGEGKEFFDSWEEAIIHEGSWDSGYKHGPGTAYNTEGEIIMQGEWDHGRDPEYDIRTEADQEYKLASVH